MLLRHPQKHFLKEMHCVHYLMVFLPETLCSYKSISTSHICSKEVFYGKNSAKGCISGQKGVKGGLNQGRLGGRLKKARMALLAPPLRPVPESSPHRPEMSVLAGKVRKSVIFLRNITDFRTFGAILGEINVKSS